MHRLMSTCRHNGRRLLALIAVLSLTALLAAACSSDGNSDGSDNGATATPTATPGATQTPGDGQTPPDGDGTPTPTETPDDGGSDSDSLSSELQSLASEWADKTARVTYEFSSQGQGEDFTGEMTLYWRSPEWRMDMLTADGEVIMIAAEDKTLICSEGACLAVPNIGSAGVGAPPFLGTVTDPDAFSASISNTVTGVDVDSFQETIAGESADCFSVSGSFEGESGDAEWCFSDDGIMLRFAGAFEEAGEEGEFRLEATAVSREVTDGDFEPPYPVTEFNLP